MRRFPRLVCLSVYEIVFYNFSELIRHWNVIINKEFSDLRLLISFLWTAQCQRWSWTVDNTRHIPSGSCRRHRTDGRARSRPISWNERRFKKREIGLWHAKNNLSQIAAVPANCVHRSLILGRVELLAFIFFICNRFRMSFFILQFVTVFFLLVVLYTTPKWRLTI